MHVNPIPLEDIYRDASASMMFLKPQHNIYPLWRKISLRKPLIYQR
jgi:hypothetical protein